MAGADIQVVNPANLIKIESFLNDSTYKDVIESSSTFNSRLCADRRMRMPFLDPQTGVAQTHCNLFMSKRQRMPGAKEGQVYTYPAQRWRKARRQYLTPQSSRWGWNLGAEASVIEGVNEDSSGLPAEVVGGGEDSRDGSQSAQNKDDPKDWFYDDLAIEEDLGIEEPEQESDEDYFDDTYANRRKRRGGATGLPASGPGSRGGKTRARVSVVSEDGTPAKRGRAGGRGRRRAITTALPYEVPGDADKPYGCELCGARYKTRPGLTYHFTHTHKEPKEGVSDGDSRDSARATDAAPSTPGPAVPVTTAVAAGVASLSTTEYQDSYVTFLNNPAGAAAVAAAAVRRPTPPPRPASADTSSSDSTPAPAPPAVKAPTPTPTPSVPAASSTPAVPSAPAAPATPVAVPAVPTVAAPVPVPATASASASGATSERKEGYNKASPSPYCDFCLGDDRENKKTGIPELLVSCSDCGRSGHPTCLQFTANMIVSVRKYRWQCIECKCCSVCGNSDNDDQLLFCDDCDRGYHMYCLAPPLATPPEGSWSCALCLKEFHKK